MQIERWADVYRSTSALPIPLLEEGAAWLHDRAPPLDRVALVHGDPGPGNFVHDGQRVLAFTDWEFSHLGDPTEDWAFLVSMRGARTMPLEDWLALIRREAGVELDAEALRYWRAFNFFKGACANRSCLAVVRRRQPGAEHGAHRHRAPADVHAPDGRPRRRLTARSTRVFAAPECDVRAGPAGNTRMHETLGWWSLRLSTEATCSSRPGS